MVIESKELVKRFYEEVAKHKYPQYNKQQIFLVCHIPFRYFRKAVGNPAMPKIRLKYIGEFWASPFKIIAFLKSINKTTSKRHNLSRKYIESIMSNCAHVIDREICELEEKYTNDKGLVRGNLNEKKYLRLIKYFKQYEETANNIRKNFSVYTGKP